MTGKGMGKRTCSFIPLPDIPLPNPVSAALPFAPSLWLRIAALRSIAANILSKELLYFNQQIRVVG
jgi:hypothetical protein